MEQRTLQIGDREIRCYEDGSVEYENRRKKDGSTIRTFGNEAPSQRYKKIVINVGKKATHIFVHRLIAMAFIPNPNNLTEVDHINRDKYDNRPENLRWVDHDTNMRNLDSIQSAKEKYGFAPCENKKLYSKLCSAELRKTKACLRMKKPDGKCTSRFFSSVDDPVYKLLEPLSQKERFLKHEEFKNA